MNDQEYAEKEKALFDEAQIPEEFRGRLSGMAYERGHSSGNNEVWIILRGLVSDLQEPIAKFKRRIQLEMVPKML